MLVKIEDVKEAIVALADHGFEINLMSIMFYLNRWELDYGSWFIWQPRYATCLVVCSKDPQTTQ